MKQDEFNAVLNVLSRYAPREKCIYWGGKWAFR